MVNSLSGRFLILTVIFVMLAEVLIFVPSVARFRLDHLQEKLEMAQIASLSVLASERGAVSPALAEELLQNAEVYNVVLWRDATRQLILSSPVPGEVTTMVDLTSPTTLYLIRGALEQLWNPAEGVIVVRGTPTNGAGELIEVSMPQADLRKAMVEYGLNILVLSAVISVFTAALLFLAVRRFMVRPINRVMRNMKTYSQAPEDARRIMKPQSQISELRDAEVALAEMQTQLASALKQKDRLAQLGGAVAKISHDLRNMLTTATLLADRMEVSADPTVKRSAPKLVNSLSRAVNLCESTLAFGRVDEPPPKLAMTPLAPLVEDVMQSERLSSGPLVSFHNEIPAHMSIRCDAEQMFRVLGNLVRNARQAIEATGRAGAIRFAGDETEDEWCIEITDTGPGLPQKAQENLFTAFEGGARKGGTGLGLAISSELIRGHGGSLDLVESSDAGTRFRLSLPKRAAELGQAAE